MKTILRISFDIGNFNNIIIENPGHYPSHGEIFICKWDDFIEDKKQVQELEEIEEEECWMVERFSSKLTKEENVCHIVLHLSKDFAKYQSLR